MRFPTRKSHITTHTHTHTHTLVIQKTHVFTHFIIHKLTPNFHTNIRSIAVQLHATYLMTRKTYFMNNRLNFKCKFKKQSIINIRKKSQWIKMNTIILDSWGLTQIDIDFICLLLFYSSYKSNEYLI